MTSVEPLTANGGSANMVLSSLMDPVTGELAFNSPPYNYYNMKLAGGILFMRSFF